MKTNTAASLGSDGQSRIGQCSAISRALRRLAAQPWSTLQNGCRTGGSRVAENGWRAAGNPPATRHHLPATRYAPKSYGALVASQFTRETTVSGLAAGLTAATPTS